MTATPTISYTDKDFAALQRALLEFARYRLPEWTDRSPADLGMLWVDLFAYMGDIVLYYQDRVAHESFLATAVERRSVQHLLRLIGYELAAPVAAAAELDLVFATAPAAMVTIPRGTRFLTRGLPTVVPFEYLGDDLDIHLDSDQVEAVADGVLYRGLPVRQCRSVASVTLGSSTGEPNQRFALSTQAVIAESVAVEVDEGAGWVRWDKRDSLLYDVGVDGRVRPSGPDARHYVLEVDHDGAVWVRFGDGTYGRRPPTGAANLRATYRAGGGAVGNVQSLTITAVEGALPQLVRVTNPLPAAGGTDAESTEHAREFGPASYRSRDRAVTLDDYVALAHRSGGVKRARARARGWNRVELYVAPEGDAPTLVPEDLRRRLLAYLEDRRMAGTFVDVMDPTIVPIDVGLQVLYNERFHADAVRQAVSTAVAAWLDYDAVDFGHVVSQTTLLDDLGDVAGVEAVTVTRLRRGDEDTSALEARLAAAGLPTLDALPDFVRTALKVDLPDGGRIELGAFELPELGALDIQIEVRPR